MVVMSEISVRAANQDDYPFIFASWLRSYKTSDFAKNIPPRTYFTWHHAIVEHLLKRSTVLIAHPTDSPNTIVGYMVHEKNVIHYCSVKKDFRKLGVATRLILESQIDLNKCQYTHSTKDIAFLYQKFPNLEYNPYAI